MDLRDVFRPGLMSGKNVLVVGGTSGIGFAVAKRFVDLNAGVFVVSRSPHKVQEAISQLGPNAAGAPADVRDYEALSSAVGRCADRGPIDVVVSCAAGNFLARAADLSPKGFRTVIDIDLVGGFHVMKAAYDHLRRPGASIVNISALQSFLPMRSQVHACAAKAGLDAMMRTLAREWGEDGLRINSVAPGPIAGTEGMARLTPNQAAVDELTRSIPLGRYGDALDIADLVVFLASEAARNITGALLISDGGQSLSAADVEMRGT